MAAKQKTRKWSAEVTKKSDALDLREGVLTSRRSGGRHLPGPAAEIVDETLLA